MKSNQMRVILGASSLKAYVSAPKAFHVMGIVRFGMEYGLLATKDDGLYFRVNGSHIEALDGGEVRRAIDHSYGEGGRFANHASNHDALPSPIHPPQLPSAPRISIRKHRQVQSNALHSQHGLHAANA